jgi:tetratricopeptide (TPR) repeat protein
MDSICREKLEFANKLIFVRNYDEAERVLLECSMLPDAGSESLLHIRRIELMSLLGRVSEISVIYNREASDPSKSYARLYALIARLFSLESQAETVAEIQNYVRTFGVSAVSCFALGYASEQSGDLEKAKAYYEQSISIDPEWYPSIFGLSQVYFNLGDEVNGDRFFQQFESLAPYNVYGNFETHKKIFQEFFSLNRFDEAERAVQLLTSWWTDNKGYAPSEIQVYELFAASRVSHARKEFAVEVERRSKAVHLAKDLIESSTHDENTLYFLANVLEEFGESVLAFQSYKRVLQIAGSAPEVIQKVGTHFLGGGQFDAALELFEHAYECHPDNPEVRFCLLVAKLKKAGVAVEEYLIARERVRNLADNGDRVELLGILNVLMQKFPGDWDVHFHLAEIFLRMGHLGKATVHYEKMFSLDPLGQVSRLRMANFLMTHDDTERAMSILKLMPKTLESLNDTQAEVEWLKATYYSRNSDWKKCDETMKPLKEKDPWNITYLIQEIVNLTGIADPSELKEPSMIWTEKLTNGEEAQVNWRQFSQDTARHLTEHRYALAYARSKLQFLYMRGSESVLKSVVNCACSHDASMGAKELLRLLNTNFDTPAVYWGLGLLYKELWQLEVASMWFEHALQFRGADEKVKGQIYVDLADTYVWRNTSLAKATEYCRLALDVGDRKVTGDERIMTVLAHSLLLQGQARQAVSFLEHLTQQGEISYEVTYLTGLVQYRNGRPKQANEIWKPLLKYRAERMRDHKIKQEILKYYYEASPYQPHDLSKAN